MTTNTETTKTPLLSLTKTILQDLNNLEDGWLGSDSIAPSSETISDVKRLLKALNLKSKDYLEVCVDEDGKVSFFWWFNSNNLLSIDIVGNGKAVCTYTPENIEDVKFGVFDASDRKSITEVAFELSKRELID